MAEPDIDPESGNLITGRILIEQQLDAEGNVAISTRVMGARGEDEPMSYIDALACIAMATRSVDAMYLGGQQQ